MKGFVQKIPLTYWYFYGVSIYFIGKVLKQVHYSPLYAQP